MYNAPIIQDDMITYHLNSGYYWHNSVKAIQFWLTCVHLSTTPHKNYIFMSHRTFALDTLKQIARCEKAQFCWILDIHLSYFLCTLLAHIKTKSFCHNIFVSTMQKYYCSQLHFIDSLLTPYASNQDAQQLYRFKINSL